MVRRLWSTPLEGEVGTDLFVTARGQIVASTSRYDNEPERKRHLHRCYRFEPDGRCAWIVDGIAAQCEAPNGGIVALNDGNDLVMIDNRGEIVSRMKQKEEWRVKGWNRGKPVTESVARPRSVVVDGSEYIYDDYELRRLDADGTSARYPIANQIFDELFATGPVRAISCCNFVTGVTGNRFAHVACCGSRVTFMTGEGQIVRSHAMRVRRPAILDSRGTVCVEATDAVHGFDCDGEHRWVAEIPGLNVATTHDDVLFTIAGTSLELTALKTS